MAACRVYEKIKERMEESSEGISGLKKTLVRWAKEKGLEGNRNREQKYILLPFIVGGKGG